MLSRVRTSSIPSLFTKLNFIRGRSLTSPTTNLISEDSSLADESPLAILLIPEDYPPSFRGVDKKAYAHPDDYKITTTPIKPEVFLYRGSLGPRDRLFLRTSIKLNSDQNDNRFTSATFLFDTSCCPHFNVSDKLLPLLKDRIKTDEGREFYLPLTIDNVKHNCTVKSDLPDIHKPANVMGLPMFFALGVAFKKGKVWSFELDEEYVAHNVADVGSFQYL